MTIHLYTTCWNEADMLGFLFRHYDPWVDQYIIHDDGSTDGTIDILKAHPRVELRQFQRANPGHFTKSNEVVENSVWKESRGRADWVVFIDVDEHLFVPDIPMKDYLQQCTAQGVTLAPALGYQMLSEEFPEADELLCRTRTWGAPFGEESKWCVFNPDAIEESCSVRGRHTAKPIGRLKLPKRDELLLLHYKYMGFDRTVRHYQAILDHFGADKKKGEIMRSSRYTFSQDKRREDWNSFAKNAVDISNPELSPWRSHREERWWRPGWKFYANRWVARHRIRFKRKWGFG